METNSIRAMPVDEKRHLLAQLVRDRALVRRDIPASFAQRRVWVLDQVNPGTPVYNIFSGLRLLGPLDVVALRRALTEICNRHDVLRTTFALGQDDVVQRIGPRGSTALPLTDISHLPAADRAARAEQAMRQASDMVFDLATDLPLRASLLRLSDQEHLLLVTVHHIVFDAWSRLIFCDELTACYEAFRRGEPMPLPPRTLQYADFAARQRLQLSGEYLETQLGYWRAQLNELPDTEVPGSKPRLGQPHWRGDRLTARFPPDLIARLTDIGKAGRATPFMVFLSAFQLLLHRYTGARDLSVASPVAGRTSADTEDLIGLFVNTLILRSDIADNPRFVDLLERTRETTVNAFSHQELPLDQIVDHLNPPRALGRNPFTQVLFGLHNTPEPDLRLGSLQIEWADLSAGTAKADLQLAMGVENGEMSAAWVFRTDLYDHDDMKRMNSHFVTLLRAIAADPTERVDNLRMLPAGERVNVLANGRAAETVRTGETLHGRFTRHARSHPDTPAVVSADATLSYAQLDRASDALAARLRAAGTRRGDRVAIAIDRSAAMAVAVLAALKAGAAYVPLDPTFPPQRLATIVADAGPVVLLVDGPLETDFGVAIIETDVSEQGDVEALDADGSDTDLAYILYTSGSTGTPKGVAVEHRHVLNYLDGIDATAGLPVGRYAMVQPLAVDSSVIMLHGAWYHGGTLYPVGRATALDGAALARFITANEIHCVKIAPSHLDALQQATPPASLAPARWLMVGGEGSRSSWARNMTTLRDGCSIYNHYGPTEATVGVLVHQLGVNPAADQAVTTSLGRPLTGARLYVLDPAGQPVPQLVAGELYIGGTPVARGYHGRPGPTASCFVPDPFSEEPGSRMYRTGDRVRVRLDGTFEFLGREDDQVKIRGNRVELGDITAALREHPDVRDAVVRAPMIDDTRVLVAYVTPVASTDDLDVNMLQAFLAERLPRHMVPSSIMPLAEQPLSRHGKLDVKALPAPPPAPRSVDGPESATEHRVIELWSGLLGVPALGRNDDFFDLGGNSLLATRLVGRINRSFGVDFLVSHVFSHSTPATMAALIEALQADRASAQSTPDGMFVRMGGRRELPPLFCVHPVSGTVGCYTDLARLLPEYLVVAVESAGLSPGRRPLRSIPEIAERYLAALRASWPSGPYRLAGWSMGGLIAYEMAQQLIAADHEVQQTIMIDSMVPSLSADEPSDAESAASLAGDIAATLGTSIDPPPVEVLRMLSHADRLVAVRDWLAVTGLPLELDDLERRIGVFHANWIALRRYRPPIPAGPVTLIRAVGTAERSDAWRRLAGDLLTVVDFPGDHYSLLRKPIIGDLAGWLRKAMQPREAG